MMLIVVEVQAKVSQPDGRGKIFFDKPSFEIRFGKPNAKTLVRKKEDCNPITISSHTWSGAWSRADCDWDLHR